MIADDRYTVIKKINISNRTEFLVCNRCIIDYDQNSKDHIDTFINIMENRLEPKIQSGDIYIFKSDCSYEMFGADDMSRCCNQITSHFCIDPIRVTFLNCPFYKVTSKYINEILDRFTYKEEEITMTYKEKIEIVEAMIEEATKLLNKIKTTKEADEDILGEYKDMFGKKHDHNLYYVSESGEIYEVMNNAASYNERTNLENIDYFNNFFDKKYAEKSLEIASFNNKLLAFKWCYDRDYEPDWSNHKESKYFIYYDTCNLSYGYAVYSTISNNTVYFSSEEIAQKCCDWLNSELKKGDE